jgi:hypothetical protein
VVTTDDAKAKEEPWGAGKPWGTVPRDVWESAHLRIIPRLAHKLMRQNKYSNKLGDAFVNPRLKDDTPIPFNHVNVDLYDLDAAAFKLKVPTSTLDQCAVTQDYAVVILDLLEPGWSKTQAPPSIYGAEPRYCLSWEQDRRRDHADGLDDYDDDYDWW